MAPALYAVIPQEGFSSRRTEPRAGAVPRVLGRLVIAAASRSATSELSETRPSPRRDSLDSLLDTLRATKLQTGGSPAIPKALDVALRRHAQAARAIAFAHALVRELRRPSAIHHKDRAGDPATSLVVHHGAPRSDSAHRALHGVEVI